MILDHCCGFQTPESQVTCSPRPSRSLSILCSWAREPPSSPLPLTSTAFWLRPWQLVHSLLKPGIVTQPCSLLPAPHSFVMLPSNPCQEDWTKALSRARIFLWTIFPGAEFSLSFCPAKRKIVRKFELWKNELKTFTECLLPSFHYSMSWKK